MICTKCNFDNPDDQTTCRVCGAQLSSPGSSINAAMSSAAIPPERTSATHQFTGSDCESHPDVVCVPCANCSTPLCAKCTEAGVLYKLAPCGFILCAQCHRQALLRPGFCPECEAEVEFVDAVDNYVKGNFFSNFFGEAEQCPKCNSVVRTVWFGSIFPIGMLLLPVFQIFADSETLRPHMPTLFRLTTIPIIPLASYRDRKGAVIDEQEEQTRYILQRGRTNLRWNQILRTAMFWYSSIAIIILAFIIGVALKQQ
jgi:hypothetical protein